jgi:hypothetical protein
LKLTQAVIAAFIDKLFNSPKRSRRRKKKKLTGKKKGGSSRLIMSAVGISAFFLSFNPPGHFIDTALRHVRQSEKRIEEYK